MGILASGSTAEQRAVGERLASVLPRDGKPWWRTQHLLLLNLLLVAPWLSQASVGFDGSMMNGLQTLSQWRKYFDMPSSGILGTINAMYPTGKFFGVYIAAFFGDRYGRKTPLYMGLVTLLLGATLQGATKHLPQFIVARLILGFGTSFIAQSAPILYLGAILAAWTTYGTFRIQGQWAWRIPSILQGAIPFLQFCLVWLVPESPRWQIAHERYEEARKTLVKYHAGGDSSSPLVDFEMSEISQSIRMEAAIYSKTSYVDLFRTGPNRRRTLIATIVGFYGSWTGNAVISYYLVLILNTIGIKKGSDQALINGLIQIFNFLVAILAGVIVDRVGRRKLWLTSAGGMCLSFIVWTVLNSRFATTLDVATGKGVLALVFSFSFFFGIGFSPLIFLYPIEVFPYTLRGRGLTFSVSITMLGLILGQFVNPIAMNNIGWHYYILFCCLLGIFFLLVFFLFPETKGRSLEEIAEIFEGPQEEAEVKEQMQHIK